MAYSDFTFAELVVRFQLRFDEAPLFSAPTPMQPSEWLLESLRIGQTMGFAGEKSRSERLISPILAELAMAYSGLLTVQSGVLLNANPQMGLNGECDFVFSYGRVREFLTAPVFCIAEAKRQDMEWGLVQCTAQLLGAWQFNEGRNVAMPVLYGCATTGTDWRFLCYDGTTTTLDPTYYFLNDLPLLLGVLRAIVEATRPYAPVV